MRVAVWNVERLKHHRELVRLLAACTGANADILVLTETDERLKPKFEYCFRTPGLTASEPELYRATENRVSIFTNYRCIRRHSTYDADTAVCVELETEKGSLLVYGTIMGVRGNRSNSFLPDLQKQTEDFKRLAASGKPLCICGDYNLSFSDNYYFVKEGRRMLLHCFHEIGITILTADRKQCIDHVAVSNGSFSAANVAIEEWNLEKELSDHKGIVVSF